jgi:hypothetical protein
LQVCARHPPKEKLATPCRDEEVIWPRAKVRAKFVDAGFGDEADVRHPVHLAMHTHTHSRKVCVCL